MNHPQIRVAVAATTTQRVTVNLFGFLNCEKPPGMTSRDLVNVVSRRLGKKTKVGHAGTLDPLAEGVLVLGVGPAVRLIPYLQQQPKRYRAIFRLGQSSDSGDLEGPITDHPDLPHPSEASLQQAARSLVGTIEQTPSAYSAIWVDGQRAYKRARAGEVVEMPTRQVQIDSLQIDRYEFPEFEFETVCGSGTYIRSLGIDLARAAGSMAVMSYLKRLAVGPHEAQNSISLERLREDDLSIMLSPCAPSIAHLRQIKVDPDQCRRLGHGLCIDGSPLPDSETPNQEAAAVTGDGQLRAILKWKDEAWFPRKVFPIDEGQL
jgi:tRNA pseudouridine55 synthase